MPDGTQYLSPAAALGSAGAGLLDTYFPALKAERDKGEADKKYDKELQMKALHDLIASGSTQVGDIPRLMQMHADISGIGKLPGVKELIDHVAQAATRLVPYGPEATRTVDKPQLEMAPPVAAPQGLQVPQTQLMSVPAEPATPRVGMASVMAQPKAPASDLLGLNRSAVLRTVPTEETYQPTRTAGDLTQDDLEQNRKTRFMIDTQGAMTDRQAKIDAQRAKEASDLAEQRAETDRLRREADHKAKIKEIEARGGQSIGLLERKDQLAVTQQQRKDEAAYLELYSRTMSPDEAAIKAKDMAANLAVGNAENALEIKKIRIDRDKAFIQHLTNSDAVARQRAANQLTAGMDKNTAMVVKMDIAALNANAREMKTLEENLYLSGGKLDATSQSRYEELKQQQAEITERLAATRDRVNTQSAPSTSTSFKPANDGKYHYTPDQIRGALKPGQNYDDVLRQLKARPNVVVDQ